MLMSIGTQNAASTDIAAVVAKAHRRMEFASSEANFLPVVAGATTTGFIAIVIPPGALVLLPEKASALSGESICSSREPLQSVPELAVSALPPIADITASCADALDFAVKYFRRATAYLSELK
jgi:hypothetical protein